MLVRRATLDSHLTVHAMGLAFSSPQMSSRGTSTGPIVRRWLA
jgi:hypothetical protein